MPKRESKKIDSSKIPTLLNGDQNQEKQEVKHFLFIALTKECCLESLTWCVNVLLSLESYIKIKHSVIFEYENNYLLKVL